MKMLMTNGWKKRLLGLSVLVCALAILATGTSATFVSEGRAYNVITTGMLHMQLVEEDGNGQSWTAGELSGMLPGTSVERTARVRNTGNVPIFCKMLLSLKVTGQDGAALPSDVIHLDLNTAQWKERGGFYYYDRILHPGEETEPLFTTVTFDPAMGSEYMGAKVDFSVLAQAVQSDNNGTDPLESLGWSEAAKEIMQTVEVAGAELSGQQ